MICNEPQTETSVTVDRESQTGNFFGLHMFLISIRGIRECKFIEFLCFNFGRREGTLNY